MAKILLVDDDVVTLKIVSEILIQNGHQVVTVNNPYEAFEIVVRECVDIIISDAQMPGGISGFDILRTVKADGRLKDIPFALLTGKKLELKDLKKAILLGANDYIVKPVRPQILLEKVKEMLLKRQKQEQKNDQSEVRDETIEKMKAEAKEIQELKKEKELKAHPAEMKKLKIKI